MLKFSKIAIILLSLGMLVAAFPAQAWYVSEIVPCTDDCKLCHLWQLASNIINFITFNLALSIAPLLFVAAGVMFLISGGNEDKVNKARSIFINTVIGLVIIFCAWLLVDTIVKTVGGGSFQRIVPAWNQFPPC